MSSYEFMNLFVHSNPPNVTSRGTRAHNESTLRDVLPSGVSRGVVEDKQPGTG